MTTMEKKPPLKDRVARFVRWCRCHPIISILIIAFSILTAIGTLAGAVDKVWTLWKRLTAEMVEGRIDVDEPKKAITRQVALPPTYRYNGNVFHTIRLEAPEGYILDQTSIKYEFDWGDGFGNAWGTWASEPIFSDDGRLVSRVYNYWKHDRGRTITVSGTYSKKPPNPKPK